MTLRSAIDDYKRRRDSAREFPGERRSVEGTFSGLDERLVYVSREGWHRDYSYPVSGLAGVERSRFGVETLDDLERGLEELAGYFAELIEQAGGNVEYQHIENTGPAIPEALENVEMEMEA